MPKGSHKMPLWLRHMCWNFRGHFFFAQFSKLPGKVSIIISGVGAQGHLAGETPGLEPLKSPWPDATCIAVPSC